MKPYLITLQAHNDDRGKLSVYEDPSFEIKRAFWITNMVKERGGHAHKTNWQIFVVLAGRCSVLINDNTEYQLMYSYIALVVPPYNKVTLRSLDPNTVILVLCSEFYNSEDYIYD